MEEGSSTNNITKTGKDFPYLISLPEVGSPAEGFLISTQYADSLPFVVKRVFWVQQVPTNHQRGNHACYETEELLIALQGRVEVQTQTTTSSPQTFLIERPDQGLYVPAKCWIKLIFSNDAILLCLASTDYCENDYIWDYTEFRSMPVLNRVGVSTDVS